MSTGTTEKEDLDALLTHPGWLRFVNEQRAYWVDQIAQRLKTAVDDTDDVRATRRMQQLIVAKEAIEHALSWPKERLAQIQRRDEPQPVTVTDTMSRRGPGL